MAEADSICCRACGEAFLPSHGLQRYCSGACRRAVACARERGRREKSAPGCLIAGCSRNIKAAGLCGMHYARKLRHGEPLRTATCDHCGHLFKVDGGGHGPAIYCSRECALSVRRARDQWLSARRRSVVRKGERIDPVRVFARDGWRCHLCGKATLAEKRGTNDPRAPTVDHVMPLSKGGTHSWSNVRCACRRCNISKGDKALGQLALPVAL